MITTDAVHGAAWQRKEEQNTICRDVAARQNISIARAVRIGASVEGYGLHPYNRLPRVLAPVTLDSSLQTE